MNILYAGDKNIEDGLIISVLSLLRNSGEPLNIHVLTAGFSYGEKHYEPVSEVVISRLRERLKEAGVENDISLHSISGLFVDYLPEANIGTRFTPCCMLRLFADLVPELPDRLLYLDNDVICRRPLGELWHQDIDNVEFVGILDHYGSWWFRKNLFRRDYVNSGVLLLNMKRIRETGLLAKCRSRCMKKKMFMPDQSALNDLALHKKLAPRRFNEQRELRSDTVLQHFTTSFRFFPWLRTVTVKPWQIAKLHKVLKINEYDEILNDYSHFLYNR